MLHKVYGHNNFFLLILRQITDAPATEDTAGISTHIVVILVVGTRISATDPTKSNAASSGGGEQAVHCECLHTIAVAEFTKLFETIKM